MKFITAIRASSTPGQLLKRDSRFRLLFVLIVGCVIFCLIPLKQFSQTVQDEFADAPQKIIEPNYQTSKKANRNFRKQQELIKRFSCFGNITTTDSYLVALCADVPDNRRPYKPYYKAKSGHVFLIFTKISGANDTIHTAFGFYPLHPDFSVFPHNVNSNIRDNGGREYDVQIEKKVNALEFVTILETAVRLCTRKYHLKKYNCYDYGLEIFNAVMKEKLPNHHVRFPLLLGKGGSPCGLYQDLEKMKFFGNPDGTTITFGSLKSPIFKTSPAVYH